MIKFIQKYNEVTSMKEYISPEFERIKYEVNEVLLDSVVEETIAYESEDISNFI